MDRWIVVLDSDIHWSARKHYHLPTNVVYVPILLPKHFWFSVWGTPQDLWRWAVASGTETLAANPWSSIGLRSGEFWGQVNTLNSFLCSSDHFWTIFSVAGTCPVERGHFHEGKLFPCTWNFQSLIWAHILKLIVNVILCYWYFIWYLIRVWNFKVSLLFLYQLPLWKQLTL